MLCNARRSHILRFSHVYGSVRSTSYPNWLSASPACHFHATTAVGNGSASVIRKIRKPSITHTALKNRIRKDINASQVRFGKSDPQIAGKPNGATTLESNIGMSLASSMKQRGTVVREQSHGLTVDNTELEPIDVGAQPDVARIAHGLDRVLFNPGVTFLQDPHTCVYNFDPYLREIMPVTEFDFDATAAYITSSKDLKLRDAAAKARKKYYGSTSSMTSMMSHFHFLISAWRPVNTDMLSKGFPSPRDTFTRLSRTAASIFLRYKGDGIYAIDSDKSLDDENVLRLLGRTMEKMLTQDPMTFAKLRKGSAQGASDALSPDSYNYSGYGDFMMRSQLDTYDPRLPGTGMYDLKTRAVVSVRMDVGNFELGSGYQIKSLKGEWESFEKEYYDMIRGAFLKYSLQARIGRMDGIFVAYHNTEKIFGFQYIPLSEMDQAIHGSSIVAEKEFLFTLQLLNKMLDKATEKFPERSLRIFFETRETATPLMYMFAEPLPDEEIDKMQEGEGDDIAAFLNKIKLKLEDGKSHSEWKEVAERFGDLEPEEPALDCGSSITRYDQADGEGSLTGGYSDARTRPLHKDVGTDAQQMCGTSPIEENAFSIARAAPVSTTLIKAEFDEAFGSGVAPTASEEEMPRAIPEKAAIKELDQTFIDDLENEAVELKEKATPNGLLALTLTTSNFVNSSRVLRPATLSESDNWEVAYSIAEIDNVERAISTYAKLKKRQEKSLLRDGDEDRSQFMARLRELSRQGRRWDQERLYFERGGKTIYTPKRL